MNKKIKILIVNIAFRENSFYKRWRLLSEDYNIDVTLIGPKYDEYTLAGPKIIFKPKEIKGNNFRVKHINMKPKKWLRNDWFSLKYIKILKKIKPDFIYLIGYETRNIVFISELIRRFLLKKTKIALFTMRGINMPLSGIEYKFRWKLSSKIFDAIFCHYPEGKNIIKNQGKYNGPIYIQTQIGVDKDIYKPNKYARKQIRNKYNISENEFVFGSAIRIEYAKGVFDILNVCKIFDRPFKYLLLGNGKDFEKIKYLIAKFNLKDKLILTGRIPNGEAVAAHLNAMDCFIHIPRTTEKWVDTFPLAVVQAMAVGLPIIGSDSGAVPYQLGKDGIIIPEGNVRELKKAMDYIMNNREKAQILGEKMRDRVLETFEIRHLNKCFYNTLQDILHNEYHEEFLDQVNFKFIY